VEKLTRSAQFRAVAKKEEIQDLAPQVFLSAEGFDDAPAGRTDGGVIAQGGIRREAVLNLVALRALTGPEPDASLKLQRYILGLSLVALMARSERFLRQGCLLVPKDGNAAEAKVVDRSGGRRPLEVTEESALAFAGEAAKDFGVGEAWTATFDKDAVKAAQKKKEEKPARAK
jgi:CRISPR-associated protein Csb1